MVLSMFLRLVFGQFFIFSARHQVDAWTLALQKTRQYGVILWVLRVLGRGSGSGLKITVRGYFSSEFSLVVAPY